MIKWLIVLSVLGMPVIGSPKCTGEDPCNVCKNCRYCAYCTKTKGHTCGKCKSVKAKQKVVKKPANSALNKPPQNKHHP